jgi:hypothetical protein
VTALSLAISNVGASARRAYPTPCPDATSCPRFPPAISQLVRNDTALAELEKILDEVLISAADRCVEPVVVDQAAIDEIALART